MKKLIPLILLLFFANDVLSAENPPDPERFWLIFVFDSYCQYSAAEAPQLAELAQNLNIPVSAIARDGRPLPTWPSAWLPDQNGALYRLDITPSSLTPIVILMDSKTHQRHLLTSGYKPIEDLRADIERIAGITAETKQ